MRLILWAVFIGPSFAVLYWIARRLLARPARPAWQGLAVLAVWGVMAALIGNGALTPGRTDSPMTIVVIALLLASWGGVAWLFKRHPIPAGAK